MMNEQDRILLLHQKWTGTISEADRIRLEKEFASDEAFRKEAEWLESVWAQAGPSGLEFRPNIEKGWARLREEMNTAPGKQPARVFRLPRLLRVAAAAALLIFAWYAVRLFNDDGVQIVAEDAILAAQVLPDQSLVWLNEGSTLEFPESFSSKARRVVLTGEAYFEVDADPSHPFIVKTPHGEVRVTGTKFNVRAYANEDFEEVFVREGKVRFRSRKGKRLVDLTGGQKAVLKKSTPQLTPPVASQEYPLLWLGEKDVIEFRGVPLSEVLTSMGRYLRVDFDTARLPASVLNCPMTFTFRREDGVEVVTKVIASQAQIEFREINSRSYRLTGGICNK
jgi:ferric-dicitrate binding protein FerR (iron transport regulator)